MSLDPIKYPTPQEQALRAKNSPLERPVQAGKNLDKFEKQIKTFIQSNIKVSDPSPHQKTLESLSKFETTA